MRGALLALLRSCTNPSFTQLAFYAIKALNCAECEAVVSHSLRQEQPFVSSIFHSLVVSDEVVPAGAFLVVIRDAIEKTMVRAKELNIDQVAQAISDCISVLLECLQPVLVALKSCCHTTKISWEDPRSSITEAWFLTMKSLLVAYKTLPLQNTEELQNLVGQSTSLMVHLVMNTRVEKEYVTEDRSDGFMSVDGPQSLALVEFIELALTANGLGTTIFALTGTIFQQEINLDYDSLDTDCNAVLVAGSVISATLLRAASGGLPPWTIEYVPDVFKSLFEASGGIDSFYNVLQAGADLKLSQTSNSMYGYVSPGHKLAGYFFDNMKPKAREEFLQKTMEICAKDDCNKWRSFKVILKANCGENVSLFCFNCIN